MTPAQAFGYGKGWPLVRGQCPSCYARLLFVGEGGYVTCGGSNCPDPCAGSMVLGALPESAEQARS